MKKTLLAVPFLFCAVILSSCANNFSVNYKDSFALAPEARQKVEYFAGEPTIVFGTDLVNDKKNMKETGYALLGSSSFDEPHSSVKDAAAVARDIGAEILIYYSNFGNSVENSRNSFNYLATYWAKYKK